MLDLLHCVRVISFFSFSLLFPLSDSVLNCCLILFLLSSSFFPFLLPLLGLPLPLPCLSSPVPPFSLPFVVPSVLLYSSSPSQSSFPLLLSLWVFLLFLLSLFFTFFLFWSSFFFPFPSASSSFLPSLPVSSYYLCVPSFPPSVLFRCLLLLLLPYCLSFLSSCSGGFHPLLLPFFSFYSSSYLFSFPLVVHFVLSYSPSASGSSSLLPPPPPPGSPALLLFFFFYSFGPLPSFPPIRFGSPDHHLDLRFLLLHLWLLLD